MTDFRQSNVTYKTSKKIMYVFTFHITSDFVFMKTGSLKFVGRCWRSRVWIQSVSWAHRTIVCRVAAITSRVDQFTQCRLCFSWVLTPPCHGMPKTPSTYPAFQLVKNIALFTEPAFQVVKICHGNGKFHQSKLCLSFVSKFYRFWRKESYITRRYYGHHYSHLREIEN